MNMTLSVPDRFSPDFLPFQKIIEKRCGLKFDGERRENLFNSLSARMLDTGKNSPQEYLHFLAGSDEEFSSLISLLTNNETYFFREPIHLEIMTKHVIPELLAQHKERKPIRILCAGCSTGEEAYSVAIALIEKFGLKNRVLFNVLAVDIDQQAIEKARQGVFGNNALRSIDKAILTRYFRMLPKQYYAIEDMVKECVSFSCLNLCDESYPSFLRDMDIILFRNVSIYFSPATRHAVFIKLSNLLNPDGCLFFSSVEVFHHSYLASPDEEISLEEKENIYFFRKMKKKATNNNQPLFVLNEKFQQPVMQRKLKAFSSVQPKKMDRNWLETRITAKKSVPIQIPRMVDPRRDDETRQQFNAALDLARNGEYESALTTLAKAGHGAENIQLFSLKACILLNMQEIEHSRLLCREILNIDPFHPESLIILGLAARQEDHAEEALQFLKKAVYVRPGYWLPHYYLGEVYHTLGQWVPASREYQVVLHQLSEKNGFFNHGLPFFSPSFSSEELRHLCRNKLDGIKGVNSQPKAS